MWWLSRPCCQEENCWGSTDLSHSYGETLSPQVRVKEVSPTLDVSLLLAGSATRGRGRSALFPSDTLFAPSKSRLEIVQVNGFSARCIQSGRAPMTVCACCGEAHWHPPQPSTRVVKTHNTELSWNRQNCCIPHEHKQGWTRSRTDEKQNDEGALHTLTGTCTHDKISVESGARPIRALFCAHWATTVLARASVIRSLHNALAARACLFRGRCVPFVPTATWQQDKSTQSRALQPFVSSSFILTVSTIAYQLPECTRRAPCQRTNCCRSSVAVSSGNSLPSATTLVPSSSCRRRCARSSRCIRALRWRPHPCLQLSSLDVESTAAVYTNCAQRSCTN